MNLYLCQNFLRLLTRAVQNTLNYRKLTQFFSNDLKFLFKCKFKFSTMRSQNYRIKKGEISPEYKQLYLK